MTKNIFISSQQPPPSRWKQAFPGAVVWPILPAEVTPGSLVWLHNLLPAQLPAGKRPSGVKLIVMRDEPNDQDGLEALAQGAAGYCNAHATPEMLEAIESVVAGGGLWVGESLLTRMIGAISARSPMSGRQHDHPELEKLSQREREIAQAVAQGARNKEIARQFGLAERTIKAYLTSIFEKLGVRDRLELTVCLNTPK